MTDLKGERKWQSKFKTMKREGMLCNQKVQRKWITYWDNNSNFVHRIASGEKITKLRNKGEVEEGVENEVKILEEVVRFYENFKEDETLGLV